MNETTSTMTRVPIIRTMAVKDYTIPYADTKVDDAKKASFLARELIPHADREHLLVCCVDNKCHPVSLETIAIGTINACLANAREIYKYAILSNAANIILFHNHVSGDPTPSKDDIAVTKRMVQAGKILGIPLLDHIVIGDGGKFHSLREEVNFITETGCHYGTRE